MLGKGGKKNSCLKRINVMESFFRREYTERVGEKKSPLFFFVCSLSEKKNPSEPIRSLLDHVPDNRANSTLFSSHVFPGYFFFTLSVDQNVGERDSPLYLRNIEKKRVFFFYSLPVLCDTTLL